MRQAASSNGACVDCSYPEQHADAHHPHQETGRLVCHICHPPSYVLVEDSKR